MAQDLSPEEYFIGRPLGMAVYERVHEVLAGLGPVEVRVSKSQVAFRRRRGFAYLWLPGRGLARPGADVVLSIALGRQLASPRYLDEEVFEWLREAADGAS